MPTTSLGCSDGAGVQNRLKVEDVVIDGDRQPHVFLNSKASAAAVRDNKAGLAQGVAQAAFVSI